jgi:hypothetical protein
MREDVDKYFLSPLKLVHMQPIKKYGIYIYNFIIIIIIIILNLKKIASKINIHGKVHSSKFERNETK